MARPVRRTRFSPLLFALLLAAGSSCAGDPVVPDPPAGLPASCAEAGTSHSGTVSGRWSAVDGPHHLTDTVYVANGTLTIGSGALVCGAEGAAIVLGRDGALLASSQSDSATITFTATDSMRPWGGIVAPGFAGSSVSLAHVVVQHAEQGVHAEKLSVQRSVIREIQGSALEIRSSTGGSDGTVRSTRIENACLGSVGGGAAVVQGAYTDLVLDDVTIRGSGCTGIYVNRRTRLSLSKVSIEGSAGVGLNFSGAAGGDPILADVEDLRITGGADRPARLTWAAASAILAAVPRENLTGNAIDRIVVMTGITDYRVTPQLGLELEPASYSDYEIYLNGTLTLEPGSQLVLRGNLPVDPGELVALGTAADPVRIEAPDGEWEGLRFVGSEADTTRLEHVQLENIVLTAADAHAVRLSDVEVKGGWVELRSSGSGIESAVIEDANRYNLDVTFAALTLGAPGIRVEGTTIRGSLGHGIRITAPDARVEGCSITGGARAAILVAEEGGSAVVRGCDLVGNAGAGVHNTTSTPVDAESNWWGDPAGPEGENGDGVVGAVDFDPWLDEPAVGEPAA